MHISSHQILPTSTGTWQEEIKALCSHQSELICDALSALLTYTEVIHSKKKEGINDSTLCNINKKTNAPKYYLNYLLFLEKTRSNSWKKKFQNFQKLIYCIGEFMAPLKSVSIRTRISFWCFPTNSIAWSRKYTRWI